MSNFHLGLLRVIPISLFALAGTGRSQPSSNADMFSRSEMEVIDLPGLRVWMGNPIRVTSQVGWDTVALSRKGEWKRGCFIQLTPVMGKFPGGQLIVTYAMDPDAQDDPFTLSAFQLTKDGGLHWGRRYTLLQQHNPMIFIPRGHNSLLGVPSELWQRSPGDEENFVGVSYIFEHGGERLVSIPEGMRVVDWPWPLALFPGPQPEDNWQVGLRITGSVVKIGGRLLITAEAQKKGDLQDHDLYAVLLASQDGGTTWKYYSTIANPDRSLDSAKGSNYEGPNEPFVLQLGDGSLMAVFRVGSGWNLRRCYSNDEGRTWTKDEAIPPWSVKPQIARTGNGTIALTTGRPGINLWLSTDPRAESWQKIDLVVHHNKCMSDQGDRISHGPARTPIPGSTATGNASNWQTSGYTGIEEVGPNRLLIAYDRCPERVPTELEDRSSVFVVPVEVERK